jgi:uncharacterized protein
MKRLFFLLSILSTSVYSQVQIRAIRLLPGQDVRKELEAFILREKIEAASILSAVGSVKSAKLRFANRSDLSEIKGPLEIVSFSGTLGKDGPHLHMSVSDGEGKTIGGHLGEGSLVFTTLELVLGVYPHLSFHRIQDAKTGYKELEVKVK